MEEAAGLQLRFLLGVNSQGLRPGSLEAKCGQAALCLPAPACPLSALSSPQTLVIGDEGKKEAKGKKIHPLFIFMLNPFNPRVKLLPLSCAVRLMVRMCVYRVFIVCLPRVYRVFIACLPSAGGLGRRESVRQTSSCGGSGSAFSPPAHLRQALFLPLDHGRKTRSSRT